MWRQRVGAIDAAAGVVRDAVKRINRVATFLAEVAEERAGRSSSAFLRRGPWLGSLLAQHLLRGLALANGRMLLEQLRDQAGIAPGKFARALRKN